MSVGRVLPYGEAAVLIETDRPLDLAAAVLRATPDGLRDVVPAAATVLVSAEPAVLRSLTAILLDLDLDLDPGPGPGSAGPAAGAEVVLDVHYDGPDLVATAADLGLDADGLVRAHTAGEYVAAFCGFAPGFAYLAGLAPELHVARLAEPRTRVPAGAVGLAGEFTGVYPRPSPGGWRLVGRCEAPLWDVDRDPPALLSPGSRVRFRAV